MLLQNIFHGIHGHYLPEDEAQYDCRCLDRLNMLSQHKKLEQWNLLCRG